MAVKKGQKRGPYKRAQLKREIQKNSTPEDGMTYIEIANIMNISIAEVKQLERTAIRKLKKPTPLNQKFHEYCNISLRSESSSEIEL